MVADSSPDLLTGAILAFATQTAAVVLPNSLWFEAGVAIGMEHVLQGPNLRLAGS
jgi:hypothetical protein